MLSAGLTFWNVAQVKALDSVPFGRRGELPDAPGLYFALVDGEQVAYIGASKTSLRRRWKEHNRRVRLQRLGSIEIAYVLCDDLPTLIEAESAAIAKMAPILNTFHVAGAYDRNRRYYEDQARKPAPPPDPA